MQRGHGSGGEADSIQGQLNDWIDWAVDDGAEGPTGSRKMTDGSKAKGSSAASTGSKMEAIDAKSMEILQTT